MNAKILVFAVCVKTILYLLLHDLHDCAFKILSYSVMNQKNPQ